MDHKLKDKTVCIVSLLAMSDCRLHSAVSPATCRRSALTWTLAKSENSFRRMITRARRLRRSVMGDE